MKKDFLFYTPSFSALKFRSLAYPFFEKGSISIKTVLLASVLVAALGYSTATVAMDPPSKDESDFSYNAKLRSYVPSQEASEMLSKLTAAVSVHQYEDRELTPDLLKGFKEIVEFERPNNGFSDEDFRDTFRCWGLASSMQPTFLQLLAPIDRKNVMDILGIVNKVRRNLKDLENKKEISNPTKDRLQRKLLQRQKVTEKTNSSPAFQEQPISAPLKKTETTPENTSHTQTKKGLPQGKKEVKVNKGETIGPVKTIAQILAESKEKKIRKTRPSEKKPLPLEAKPPLPLESHTPFKALETWINAQKYKSKPTYQFKETNREGPAHALIITYEATLEMPETGKKKQIIRIVGRGAGSAKNEARDNAIQNLLDVLEGKISREPKKESASTQPEKDAPKPLALKPQPHQPVDPTKIHMHSKMYDVVLPEEPTLPKPEERKPKNKKPKNNPQLLTEISLSKASSIQDSKTPIAISPTQPPVASQQQQEPQPSELTHQKVDHIIEINHQIPMPKNPEPPQRRKRRGAAWQKVIKTDWQVPIEEKKTPVIDQTPTRDKQVLLNSTPLKADRPLPKNKQYVGAKKKEIHQPQKLEPTHKVDNVVAGAEPEKQENPVIDQTVTVFAPPVIQASSPSERVKAATSLLPDKNKEQVMARETQDEKPRFLAFLPTKGQLQQHYSALRKMTGRFMNPDPAFASWIPIARGFLYGKNVPYQETNNHGIVLIPLNTYTTYVERISGNQLELIHATLERALQHNHHLSVSNQHLNANIYRLSKENKDLKETLDKIDAAALDSSHVQPTPHSSLHSEIIFPDTLPEPEEEVAQDSGDGEGW
jgi:hypothetical protein